MTTTVSGLTRTVGGVTAAARNQWMQFLIRRIGRAVVGMFVVVTAAFLVLHLTGGDPVRSALGPTAPASAVRERRDQLGLNHPLLVQYRDYVTGLFHGRLGVSFITGDSVTDLVKSRLAATLDLAGIAFVVVLVGAILLGLGIGVLTQGSRHRGVELAFTAVTGFLAAIPEYLVAVVLVIVLAIAVHAFPVAGQSGAASYVLPVAALSVGALALLSRIARVEALSVLQEDYIRTARAKRMPARRVYLRHALPNMLTATLTLGGTLLTTMVVSTVLVEQVFNWPGMGTAFVQAITTRDYGIVQGLALVYAALILVVNLTVDLVLALLDRRTTLLETA